MSLAFAILVFRPEGVDSRIDLASADSVPGLQMSKHTEVLSHGWHVNLVLESDYV